MTLREDDVIAEIVKAGSQSYCGTLQHLVIRTCWYHCGDLLRRVQKVTSYSNVPTFAGRSKWRQQFRPDALKFLSIYQIKRRHILQHCYLNLKVIGSIYHTRTCIRICFDYKNKLSLSYVQVKQSLYRPIAGSVGQGGWGSQISRQSAHKGFKFQPYALAAFTSGNIPGTHFCWSLSRPQGYNTAGRIMSMTSSGIKPATFRLVAQCLKQLRRLVPPLFYVISKINQLRLKWIIIINYVHFLLHSTHFFIVLVTRFGRSC
jgi:hypothetical protein